MALSFLTPAGADVKNQEVNAYCYDNDSPETILLARLHLEALEAPNSKTFIHSEIIMKDTSVVKNNILLRSNTNSSTQVVVNSNNCLEATEQE